MCGIAGIISHNLDSDPSLIQGMTESLKHRGPDSGNTFIEKGISLGQRRLSIIDLNSNADQPFFDNTGKYVIVYNGEIYNYADVRKKIDYAWQSNSDTEVILASYLKWGKNCLNYLNGMFAFAIWNREAQELFIARDRLGVKPFYYFHSEEYFIFSSEIRSILNTGLVNKTIDRRSLIGYLSNMAVKTPASIIEGIRQLPPGHFAYLKNRDLKKTSYWQIVSPKEAGKSFPMSYSKCVSQTRLLFEDAVESRMVADVPVGAFLSGGIDSSAIVSVMSKFSQQPVQTFSIIFNEKDFDESRYARLIARKYATKHTELLLDPEDIIQTLPAYLKKMDSPTVDGINTFIVSKMVSEMGLKVALSGLGGDELFAGYNGFNRWASINKNNIFLNNIVMKNAAKALTMVAPNRTLLKVNDYYERNEKGLRPFYENSRSIFLKKEINELIGSHEATGTKKWIELNCEDIEQYPILSQYSIAELTNYTLDVLLKDTDQMSMAWGLEIREPFFDYKFIEFLLTVPDNYKQHSKVPKSLFIDAMGDLLPREIIDRPKKGFSFPWDSWMRKELKEYCHSSILQLGTRGIFNKTKLLGTWNNFTSKRQGITWTHIWSLVILEQWLKENNF